MKIIVNHVVDPRIKLEPNAGSDRSWVWSAFDFSDGELVETVFAMRFGDAEKAGKVSKKDGDGRGWEAKWTGKALHNHYLITNKPPHSLLRSTFSLPSTQFKSAFEDAQKVMEAEIEGEDAGDTEAGDEAAEALEGLKTKDEE